VKINPNERIKNFVSHGAGNVKKIAAFSSA